MTLATPGARVQDFISNPANEIRAYKGSITAVNSNMVWGNSDGIDPLYDPSSWNNPATMGWSPVPSLQFSATTTASLLPSTSSAGVAAPETELLATLAVLGLGLLTALRKIT